MKDDFRLYKAAFENTNEGICVVSTEGEFIKVNKQFCTHLGYQENELVGMHFNDVTHPDDLNVGSGIVKDLLSGDVSQIKSEKRYLTKTGEIFYALVSTTLKRDEGGEPEYFITHVFDIGDRVRAEKQFANIFNSMLDGYALHEIIVDDEGLRLIIASYK